MVLRWQIETGSKIWRWAQILPEAVGAVAPLWAVGDLAAVVAARVVQAAAAS